MKRDMVITQLQISSLPPYLTFSAALVYHVPQFHRGKQKGGRQTKYTIQVMEKENRKLFARVNNLQRTRRSYTRKSDGDTVTIATYNDNQEEG